MRTIRIEKLGGLVSNAVKYTQLGGRILVGCRSSGSDIRIDVYDTGIRIPGEQIPRIFEAFARHDAVWCDGLGISLLIVRQALAIFASSYRRFHHSMPRVSLFHFRRPIRRRSERSLAPHQRETESNREEVS